MIFQSCSILKKHVFFTSYSHFPAWFYAFLDFALILGKFRCNCNCVKGSDFCFICSHVSHHEIFSTVEVPGEMYLKHGSAEPSWEIKPLDECLHFTLACMKYICVWSISACNFISVLQGVWCGITVHSSETQNPNFRSSSKLDWNWR